MENVDLIDSFLVERFSDLMSGMVVFIGFGLFFWAFGSFLQYRLAQKLEHSHPWVAFLPLFSLLQFWQMGKQSARWGGLFFVPGVLDIFVPFVVSGGALVLVGVLFLILTIRASLQIAVRCKVSRVWGLLLLLPVVRWWIMHDLVKGKSGYLHTKSLSILSGVIWIFVGVVVSFILSILFFVIVGFLAFGKDFLPLFTYLSDPNVTPASMIGDAIQSQTDF